MKIKLKNEYIVCNFKADAHYLRTYQELLKDTENGENISKSIDTHLKNCRARQHFMIIATDGVEFENNADDVGFLTIEEMEV